MSVDSDTDTESDTSSNSETNEYNNNYIRSLIGRIIDKHPNIDAKCIYKLLLNRCKFYYSQFQEMNDDSLWQNIAMDAVTYKDENEQAGISDSASFEYGMRNHKPVLMELIKEILNDDEEEEEEEMENESIMDEKEAEIIAQNGSGFLTYRPYCNAYKQSMGRSRFDL